MKYIIYVILVASGAFLLNTMDSYNLGDLKEQINNYHVDFKINEMDEEDFQNRSNELGEIVGTEIDFGNYQCSSDNTSYFVNDICLTNADLKEIVLKVASNITPDELNQVVKKVQEY